MEHLLLLVEGGEDKAFAPEEVDVAAEAHGSLVSEDVEFQAKGFELLLVERPGVTFGGEDGRTGSVERTQGMEQRRMLLDLGKMIEVVGVFTQINEVAAGVRGIRPGNDEDGIVCGTFNGPFGEHLRLS
jgi:hypothetical protein